MDRSLTWPALEGVLRQRPRWKRTGREWHGPCPVTGDGRDTCWFGPGSRVAIVAGCRRCGTRLSGPLFLEHLGAVVDVTQFRVASSSRPAKPFEPAFDPRPGAVWDASVPAVPGTPGHAYLVSRRLVASGVELPGSVRWLPVAAARRCECRPVLPAGAAGVLVYRFNGPGEAGTRACQLEAVGPDGARLSFSRAGKRPSVLGSWTGRGRRVFVARYGQPGRGCWMVEGPLDALAVVRLAALGEIDLKGASVFGVAGVPAGFQLRACWWDGPVVMAPDVDPAGDFAILRLGVQLASARRPYRIERTVVGDDWSSLLRDLVVEREALADA